MKINIKNPIHFLAVGFGSGLLSPAPGTWGSLAGLLITIILWQLTASTAFFCVITFLFFIVGCYICGKISKDFGVHDDGRIVWDEITAIFFIFCFLPEYNWLYYLLTFSLFRLFDIWKPYPIKAIDLYLQNGFGIMFDDILAAIYTLLSLYILHWWV